MISAQSLDKCHDKCLLEDLHVQPYMVVTIRFKRRPEQSLQVSV